ncbi:MAG: hypothetical protein ACP5U1_16945 [Desulfomonilaceae bacterium]
MAGSLKALLLAIISGPLFSCSLVSYSLAIRNYMDVPQLNNRRLVVNEKGQIPYQRYRVRPWDDNYRYVWVVGDYDFRKSRQIELILYFHGMSSKDYYRDFRGEIEKLASKRPDRPFLFVGFVDTPYVSAAFRSKARWSSFSIKDRDYPELLFKTVNGLFKSLKRTFPNIDKNRTTITLAGFSGGGRVLDSVGAWLAKSSPDDPFAKVFRARLSKMVYFDCWFDKDVVNTIPALLEGNPGIKIVGTVHMKKPTELASILADKFKMRADRKKQELVGANGRIVIYRGDSHWDAMISRLAQAL